MRRLFGGLRTRLVLLMLLALLPLGLIATWQTLQIVQDNRILNRERLNEVTTAAAAEHGAAIQQAVGAGLGLATVARDADLAACRRIMETFIADNPEFTLAGIVGLDGRMICNSAGSAIIDYSDDEDFQTSLARNDTHVDTKLEGAASGEAVVIVRVPIFDGDLLDSFVSLSLPRKAVADDRLTLDQTGAVLSGVTKSGDIFTIIAGPEGANAHLPPDLSTDQILARANTTFQDVDALGRTRIYSVTDLIADSYVVVGSWPRAKITNANALLQAAMPLVFAVAMWMAGMAVAYLGLSRLVLRHLADLRSAMRRFALGERESAILELQGAPDEFKDAERAFNRMTLLITEAEARQMTDLHDKEVLLREVHHRVKNNLQMIASIMNMQARSARTDEARIVLADLQRRIRGMAMLHRSLYTQTDTSLVDAEDLIAAVVSDTRSVIPDKNLHISTDLQTVMLYPDQAVPLSMWMAEALTNSVKYADTSDDTDAFIKVSLVPDQEGNVDVIVENTIGSVQGKQQKDVMESSGLGQKLMTAFVRQLEGSVELSDEDGKYTLHLRFSVTDFHQNHEIDTIIASQNTPPKP